jgi:hypothetical protein
VIEVAGSLVAERGDHRKRLPDTRYPCKPASGLWQPNGWALSCRPRWPVEPKRPFQRQSLPNVDDALMDAGQLQGLVRRRLGMSTPEDDTSTAWGPPTEGQPDRADAGYP